MTQDQIRPPKPLGRKAYGSIPHLPGSRLGPGDHHCHEGQARICLEKARDRHDTIIVTEKLDGSNVAVAHVDGEIVALTRSGHRASSSGYEHHQHFAAYVRAMAEAFRSWLEPGAVLHGEWLGLAHGTVYALHHGPLVVFDLTVDGRRQCWSKVREVALALRLPPALCIHVGGALSAAAAMAVLAHGGGHGAMDPVEGAVWRVERQGKVDFLAKWVRPDKEDGKYLPGIGGRDPIWLWQPGPWTGA